MPVTGPDGGTTCPSLISIHGWWIATHELCNRSRNATSSGTVLVSGASTSAKRRCASACRTSASADAVMPGAATSETSSTVDKTSSAPAIAAGEFARAGEIQSFTPSFAKNACAASASIERRDP